MWLSRLVLLATPFWLVGSSASAQTVEPPAVAPQSYPAPQGYTPPPAYPPPPSTPGSYPAPQPAYPYLGPPLPPPRVFEDKAEATQGAEEDPNLDRSFLFPTAMTQPQGSLTYNNYDLLLHGLTYGLTERLQASATILPTYAPVIPFFINLAVKGQVVRAERFHLALQGSITLVSGEEDAKGFSAAVLTSVCLSNDCASLVSAGLLSLFSDRTQDYILAYSGSLTQMLSESAKLLVEINSASYHDRDDGFDTLPGILLNYGIRVHGRKLACDLGLMRPISKDDQSDWPLGIPFASFTYRAG